ncbi:MAG: hypothetical protein F4Z57_17180, partial [Gemmatimonadetes bacterium]|nr:hypothetical protein [Gemmatimonadota bacterium]
MTYCNEDMRFAGSRQDGRWMRAWQLLEQEESSGLLAAGVVQAHEIDACRQRRASLVNQFQPAGSYQVRWDAR